MSPNDNTEMQESAMIHRGESRVHVMHVVPTLGAGGMELAMSRVVRAPTTKPIRHSICCLKGEAVIQNQFDGSVEIDCLRARPNDPTLPLRLRRLISRLRPTVIHARNWGAWPDVAMARLALVPHVPLIFSFHGVDRPGRMPLRRRVACRILARITTYIFTVSAASKRMLVQDVGLPARRIDIIPNGVDADRFSPSPPRGEGGPLVVGTVGSLTPVKNQSLLIRACAELLSTGSNLELRLAGDGPEKEKLSQLARTLEVEDRVHFAGHIEDVPGFLRGLDVFVLPSDSEGHPNALLEAMSCGIPCVATGVGGVPEVLGDGRFGRLIAPGDLKALVAELKALGENTALRRRLGEAGRERVVRRYSMRRMIQQYDRLYHRVTGRYSGLPEVIHASPQDPERPEVIMLGPLPPPVGGMATVTSNLRESDLARRCRLTVINNAKTTSAHRSLFRGMGAQLKLLHRLTVTVLQTRARVVHIHTCSGFTFWRDSLHMSLVRVLGARGVWHIHGGYFDRFVDSLGPIGKRLLRWVLESSSAAIVLGQAYNEKLVPAAQGARWYVVPNGVPVPLLPERPARSQSTFLFLGNLSPEKGVYDLVAATARAAAGGFSGVVKLAGIETAPHQLGELQRRIDEARCGSLIHLLGLVVGKQKEDAFSTADCLVLPSYAEGLPMAMLEGMAYGLPAIATRVGGIPEVLSDSVEGFLIDPGDVEGLAERILRLGKDEQLRRRMGQAARKRIQQKYTLETMVDGITKVYQDVLK